MRVGEVQADEDVGGADRWRGNKGDRPSFGRKCVENNGIVRGFGLGDPIDHDKQVRREEGAEVKGEGKGDRIAILFGTGILDDGWHG